MSVLAPDVSAPGTGLSGVIAVAGGEVDGYDAEWFRVAIPCPSRPFYDDTLRRELQRLRYTWKRSRYTLDPDPEFGGKKEAHPAATPAIAGT